MDTSKKDIGIRPIKSCLNKNALPPLPQGHQGALQKLGVQLLSTEVQNKNCISMKLNNSPGTSIHTKVQTFSIKTAEGQEILTLPADSNVSSLSSKSPKSISNLDIYQSLKACTFKGYSSIESFSSKHGIVPLIKPIQYSGRILKPAHQEEDSSLVSPSSRWLNQPKSYQGAKKQKNAERSFISKMSSLIDTTDGETSGMGSSVDEPIESSTESASETTFQQPRLTSRPPTTPPSSFKKRRGGWPKGRKRKPELQMTKKPKAPITGYVLYLNERRKFYKDLNPSLTFSETTKLMGAEWTKMTDDEKEVFAKRAEQDKTRYKTEFQIYRQSSDYQSALSRKKRMKNAMKTGNTTTEESSDFTDEVDDDEELYCRLCDHSFTSMHNKRVHLNGRSHMERMSGEYRRERLLQERRRSMEVSEISSGTENSNLSLDRGESSSIPEESPNIFSEDRKSSSDEMTPEIIPGGLLVEEEEVSTTEGDFGDEDEEYDGEEDEDDCDRVTDAAVLLLKRVVGRENELRYLRRRNEKNRNRHSTLTASLASLLQKQRLLKDRQKALGEEELLIRKKLDAIIQATEQLKEITKYVPVGRSVLDLELANQNNAAAGTSGGTRCRLPPPSTSCNKEFTVPWRVKANAVPEVGQLDRINLKPFRLKTKFIRIKTPSLAGAKEVSNPVQSSVKTDSQPKSHFSEEDFVMTPICAKDFKQVSSPFPISSSEVFPISTPGVFPNKTCSVGAAPPLVDNRSLELSLSNYDSNWLDNFHIRNQSLGDEFSVNLMLNDSSPLDDINIRTNGTESLRSNPTNCESTFLCEQSSSSSSNSVYCEGILSDSSGTMPATSIEGDGVSTLICEETFFNQFDVDFAIEANRLLNCKEKRT